jgi:GT2 family glycosyltransferase
VEGLVDLSVVVPVLDAAAYLPAFLAALAEQRWARSWEVVVADNGSTDGSVELIEREQQRGRVPGLRIVDASGRKGSAYTRNVGARHATAKALVFTDADDIPAPGYVAAMGEALRESELVCARIDMNKLNPAWATALQPSPQFDGPGKYLFFLPYAGGSTLGIRRDLFESIRGFDEELRYAQDVDLCWRAQLFGGAQLTFVPEAVLHVRHRASLRAMFRQARNWGRSESRLQLCYRPFGAPPVPWRVTYHRWRRLGRHLPRLRHRAGRAWWVTQLGNSVGRIEGALGHRWQGGHTPLAPAAGGSTKRPDRSPAQLRG